MFLFARISVMIVLGFSFSFGQVAFGEDSLPELISTSFLSDYNQCTDSSCTQTGCDHDCSCLSSCDNQGLFESLGLEVGGYLQQSVNSNNRNPTNPAAGIGNWPGPGWVYRNDEYMLNRLYMTVGRTPDTSNGQWDIGGQVDVLYGTDYQFMQSRGLETHSDFSNKWNSDSGSGLNGLGLMGMALPQAYLQVANDVASLKLGHFYHPLGSERYDVTGSLIGNTASYTSFFIGFLPITGAMADVKLTDQLTLTGGVHRGSGNWEDNNDEYNGVGGLTWSNSDGSSVLKYVFDIGAEDNAGQNDQYIQSIVFEHQFGEKWTYIFHSDYGVVQNGVAGGGDAEFYSLVNWIGYAVNEKLNVGARYEMFDDIDGTRVAFTPGPGRWNEVSVGGTYKVTPQLWLRPTVRWDWFDADSGVAAGPFNDGASRSQFMAAFSVFVFL